MSIYKFYDSEMSLYFLYIEFVSLERLDTRVLYNYIQIPASTVAKFRIRHIKIFTRRTRSGVEDMSDHQARFPN